MQDTQEKLLYIHKNIHTSQHPMDWPSTEELRVQGRLNTLGRVPKINKTISIVI
jgi:hypothetical protein